MGRNVKLSESFVEKVMGEALAEHRSVPKQIEYYYKIAKAAEENPDLSFKFVTELLASLEETELSEFTFSN